MGRIKSVGVKRITKLLVKDHPGEFTEDFTKNKTVLDRYTSIYSRKVRNVIAGYASRLVKQSKSNKQKRRTNTEDLSKFYE